MGSFVGEVEERGENATDSPEGPTLRILERTYERRGESITGTTKCRLQKYPPTKRCYRERVDRAGIEAKGGRWERRCG